MNFYPSIYMNGGRSMYQDGAQTPGGDPRQRIYQMLQQRGLLGEMSFEQFAQLPPQQMMQQAQQAGQPGQQQGGEMPQPGMESMGQGLPQASLGQRITLPHMAQDRATIISEGRYTAMDGGHINNGGKYGVQPMRDMGMYGGGVSAANFNKFGNNGGKYGVQQMTDMMYGGRGMYSMGDRIPMPLDQNQVRHLTMHEHNFKDTMSYGGRVMYMGGGRPMYQDGDVYMGPIEGVDAGDEFAYNNSEPEIEPIYGDDTTKQKKGNSGAANAAAGSLLGVGSGLMKGMTDSKKSADSAENAAGTIGGSALEGASAGAAFGPWGALVGGAVGTVSGVVDWEKDKAAEQKMLQDANKATNVGGLGSSLAMYGKRLRPRPSKLALAERMEVERRRQAKYGVRHSNAASATGGIRNAGSNKVERYFNDVKRNPYYNSYYPFSK